MTPCRPRLGCCAPTEPHGAARPCPPRSSTTTTPTGTCARYCSSRRPTRRSSRSSAVDTDWIWPMAAYDAFLLVSFGGPEGPADVMPFLRNVTAGRNIPDSRLEQVAEHYYAFGGISPINEQCRDLLAAIEKDFGAAGIDLPVYWGNRNWAPYLSDTVAAMAADGVRRGLAFATSAYSSYSSCRQYLDDVEQARAAAGPSAPRI